MAFFLLSCLVSTASSETRLEHQTLDDRVNTTKALSVSCSIQSDAYLSESFTEAVSPVVQLSDVPTKQGGRALLHQSENHELWVKTHSYLRQQGKLSITAFSAVLIDKEKRQMAEAVSSSSERPRVATLIVHSMTELMALDGRLIVTCVESG